jgi:hypothetical protein
MCVQWQDILPFEFMAKFLSPMASTYLLKFIKIAPENPVLWTGMKGASAESRKNKSDAETSSA